MTAPARLDVFAPITKREQDPDSGHLYVYGKITGPDLDGDQQRMDPEWLKRAVPDWFKIGNIREMHQPKAVGKALELEEKDDGWYIGAKIVDRDTVEKINEGVLTGFSIGVKAPRLDYTKSDAPNGLITGGRLVETSVVDRPCLPTAIMSLAKADDADELQPVEHPVLIEQASTAVAEKADGPADPAAAAGGVFTADLLRSLVAEQLDALGITKADLSAAGRRKAAAAGAAMDDGAYPIATKSDLRKAIRAVGRGGADHDKIRRHIIKRAKALGLEAMVPDNWNPDGSTDTAKADTPEAAEPTTAAPDAGTAPETEAADGADTAETVAKAEAILRQVRALVPTLAKADGEVGNEQGDIDGAQKAIAAIAELIVAEAEMLAQGHLNEICDIRLLTDAASSLAWFAEREQAQNVGADSPALALADTPDLAKTDEPAAATPPAAAVAPEAPAPPAAPQTPAAPAAETLTKADVTDLVKSAVAEATKAAEERIDALAADLAKAHGELDAIKAQPMPGGPVLTRTATEQAQARNTDADQLRAQAAQLMAKADRVEDRDLRAGYRERAQALLAKADA